MAESELYNIVQGFTTQSDIAAVYLFGSNATGRARPDSDIDLAVLLSGSPDSATAGFRRLELLEAAQALALHPVDVVVLNAASPELCHAVLTEGKLVCEADRYARIEFEVRAGKEYEDFRIQRAFFTNALKMELLHGEIGRRRRRARPASALAQ